MNKQVHCDVSSALEDIKLGKFAVGKQIKFDQSVDLALNITVPKDSGVRGTVVAPNGLSRKCVVAVFADESYADADYMVSESGIADFFAKKLYKKCDVCIATKRYLPVLAKIGGKKLGTRKLMPDAKAGTLTDDPLQALKTFKNGVIAFRGSKSGSKAQKKSAKTEKLIIHASIGKVSQSSEALKENLSALISSIKLAMPPRGKIASAMLSTTMGRSVKVSIEEVSA